jgi:hypothetical protein
MTPRRRRSRWLSPTLVVPGCFTILGALLVFWPAMLQALHEESIDCGAQYKAVSEVLKEHPDARPTLPEDSPIEKQCNMNEYISEISGGAAS